MGDDTTGRRLLSGMNGRHATPSRHLLSRAITVDEMGKKATRQANGAKSMSEHESSK
jgi:hypothetical protein